MPRRKPKPLETDETVSTKAKELLDDTVESVDELESKNGAVRDICETGISWDHDIHKIYISTNRRGVQAKLKKLGFTPVTSWEGMENYVTTDKVLRIGFRVPKALSDKARKTLGERLKKARTKGRKMK